MFEFNQQGMGYFESTPCMNLHFLLDNNFSFREKNVVIYDTDTVCFEIGKRPGCE